MMKAIRVTRENKEKLELQFNMEEGYLELSSGLYLIAGDGNSQFEGLVTPGALTAEYFRTGKKLANDWFELMPKAGVQATVEFSDAQKA